MTLPLPCCPQGDEGYVTVTDGYATIQRLLRQPANDPCPAEMPAGSAGGHRADAPGGRLPMSWAGELGSAERRWVTVDQQQRTLGYAVMQYAPLLRVVQLRHAVVVKNPVRGPGL